jgi:hypothetical protein
LVYSRYENISEPLDVMERTLEHQGYLWISGNLFSLPKSYSGGRYAENLADLEI